MNIRYAGRGAAAALALFVALGAAACGGKDDNANNSNAGRNANAVATATPMPTATPVSATEDNALKNKVEANLTKASITGVTVEVKEGVVTLKGSVPTAKFQDAVKAAQEANPKKVDNQLSKK
jgi:hyperosmotically inducible protein